MPSKEQGSRGEDHGECQAYLTIAAIVALHDTLAFSVIPESMSVLFSGVVEPLVTLYLRSWGELTSVGRNPVV